MNRVVDITKKLIWGLAGLSVTSCLIRNDYNVIFSFFMLVILNNFYNQNPKLFTKIIIQLLAVLSIADVIWIIVMMPTWSHDVVSDKNEYWKSLSAIHTVGIIFAFLELALKLLTFAYLVYDFKHKNPEEVSDLSRLNYLDNLGGTGQKKLVSAENDNNANVHAGIEVESDFKNPY